ncbi:MAG: amino acid adenylation domain-containing protein [Bryobacteraceae bacterium]|nr:amino acid adenylation domain-containing protein [Bryobacteraceae bacterium]
MIGLLINTLPMRVRVDPGENLVAWLRAMQNQHTRMREFSFCSLVDIQGLSQIPRGTPLFETLVVFENYPMKFGLPGKTGKTPAFEFELFEQPSCPVELISEVSDGSLNLRLLYSESALEEGAASRILAGLNHLLSRFAEGENLLLSDLDLLAKGERKQILEEWNDTARQWPPYASMAALLEEQTAQNPNEVAVEFRDERVTFGELNARANYLALELQKRGVGPESAVAIWQKRRIAMVVSLWAVWKAGGAYVPLDVDWPKERLQWILEESEAAVVLVEEDWDQGLDEQWRDRCIIVGAATGEAENLKPLATGQNLAYIIYTSGSTGRPKGVMIPHGAALNYVQYAREAYGLSKESSEGGSLVASPLAFDLTVTSVIVPLCAGRKVKLLEEGQELEELAREVTSGTPGLVKITPAHLKGLRALLGEEKPQGNGKWVVGGEALRWELLQGWAGVQVVNEYGPTEATVGCTVYETASGSAQPGDVPIGRPIANTQLYVLDASLQAVGVGVEGELYIAGAGLARGYRKKADLTAERFLPDPFGKTGQRMYRTGDRARWRPDGNLEYLGRADEQVKIRGYRIELGEIETKLREIPGVRDAAVLAREDKGAEKHLVGYVVTSEEKPGAEELKRELASSLPEYMIPNAYVFLPAIPLTANGKVDRRALPPPQRHEAELEYIAPQTTVEEKLCEIWAEVLGVERVGIDDDFFALGGHSLTALQVISRVQSAFDVRFSARLIFESATVRQAAVCVEDALLSEIENIPDEEVASYLLDSGHPVAPIRQ